MSRKHLKGNLFMEHTTTFEDSVRAMVLSLTPEEVEQVLEFISTLKSQGGNKS